MQKWVGFAGSGKWCGFYERGASIAGCGKNVRLVLDCAGDYGAGEGYTTMPLSRKAIEELKAIYKDCYGKQLSDDEAWAVGNRLLRIYHVLTRSPTRKAESKSSNGASFD